MFSLVSLGLIRCLAVRAGGGLAALGPHGGAARAAGAVGGAGRRGLWLGVVSGQGGGHGQQVEHHAQIEGGVRQGQTVGQGHDIKGAGGQAHCQGEGHPGLAEGEAAHQETGDHGQQGSQHGDQVLTQHGLLRPALVVVGHDPQAAGKAGDHGPGGENGGAPAHFLGDKVDAGGGQQAENPQPGPGDAHRPLSQQGTGAAGPGGQGQKAADGQENRPGQGAGEQRGGVRRESAGVALVELAVLAPAQNQQRGRHRRRDKDHGPQTGGAGDGQAGARLKPMGQINPPNQQTDQAAGHGHAGQDDRFPHEKGLPSVKRREGTHSRA